MSKKKIEYVVTFKIPGPPDTFSSVSVSAGYSREDASEDDDAEIYAEAKLRAADKMDDAYGELLRLYEKIHGDI
jgi:hypothetical protein